MMSFLDAYSGYNQIKMDLAHKDKNYFYHWIKNYCYKVVSFKLKNVGAIYQWLHGCQVWGVIDKHQGSGGSVQTTLETQHEAKPWEICLRGRKREVLRLYADTQRNTCKL